jgi:hypothetical protein
MTGTRAPLRERFERAVEVRGPDECWPWRNARDRDGYGLLGEWVGGKTIKMHKAHVLAFTFAHGYPPEYQALHTCHHEWCCNPVHVYDGTPAHNAADRIVNGRMTGKAKLTIEMVQIIRQDCDGTMVALAETAKRYGVTAKTIENVIKRRTWRKVPDVRPPVGGLT